MDIAYKAFRDLPKFSLVVDRAGRIQTANTKAGRLFRSLLGGPGVQGSWHLRDLFNLEGTDAVREIISAASGEALTFDFHEPQADGLSRLRFRVGAIRSEGRVPEHFVLVSENETPLGKPFRDLNAEIETANFEARRERSYRRALKRSYDALCVANADLKSFAYSVSHDLKSPVQTVAMLLSELPHDPNGRLSADQEQILAMSRDTLGRMSVLIEELLKYTQILGAEMTRAPCDLSALIDGIAADLKSEITQAGATVRRKDLPVVEGDPVMLRILFQNLISNAVKFRHPNRAPVISIEGHNPGDGGHVRVLVSDNGIGIAPEHREKIFELFGRLHRHDEIPGSGLGLTMCRRIAHSHKGRLEVADNPKGGSVFTFHIGGADDD